MSLCLRFGNVNADVTSGDLTAFFYISASRSFVQEYRATLTKHPLDAGVSISDHVFCENPIYQIEGVISSVDISFEPSNANNMLRNINSIENENGDRIQGRGVLNGVIPPTATSINTQTSGLSKLIPDVFNQFIPTSEPDIVGYETIRPDYGNQFKNIIHEIMTKVTFNRETNLYNNNVVLCAIYDMTGRNYIRVHEDLVVTSCKFNEDQDTGDGLFFSITLEKARFTTISLDRSNAAIEMSKKTAQKKNKGKVDGTTTKKTESTEESESKKKDEGLGQPTLVGIYDKSVDTVSRGISKTTGKGE